MSITTNKTEIIWKNKILIKKIYDLIEDNKKPKFNFVTGMLAGIICSKISLIQGFGNSFKDLQKDLTDDIIDGCIKLIKEYHWKKSNILELYQEFCKHE